MCLGFVSATDKVGNEVQRGGLYFMAVLGLWSILDLKPLHATVHSARQVPQLVSFTCSLLLFESPLRSPGQQ